MKEIIIALLGCITGGSIIGGSIYLNNRSKKKSIKKSFNMENSPNSVIKDNDIQ